MPIAQHPALGAQLVQALSYWNAQLAQERTAAAQPGPPLLPLSSLSGVLLARPELGAAAQALLQVQCPRGQPLADQRILVDWVERAEWQLARSSQDCPRRSAARASELAEALRSAGWIQRSFGESTRGLAELSHDWVELFLRWDWLVAGWRALGEPSPGPGPDGLEGLETLVSVYEAHADPSDLPFWLLQRGPLFPPDAGPLLVVGQGPIDPVQLAAAAVLSAGRAHGVRLPLPCPVQPAESPWALAWPELQDLKLGRVPDPQGWPAPAERARQCEALQRTAPVHAVTLVEAAQLEPAVDAALAALDQLLGQADQPGSPEATAGVVGVVAFDRLMARRLTVRLLERGIALEDRSGWSLDTTAASAPFDGLLSLVQATVSPASLLHWLTLPMVQQALNLSVSQCASLDRALRELPTGARVLRGLPPELDARLQALRPLQQRASRRDGAPVTEWVGLIERALDHLGLEALLADDAAGLLMLGCLRELSAEHLGPGNAHSRLLWPEFRALLMRALAQARLPLQQPNARVRLMSLSEAAWYQELSALMLLGASEEHMLLDAPSPLLARRQMDTALARQPELVERALSLEHLVSVLERGIPVHCFAAPSQPGLKVRWASPWVRLRAVLPTSLQVRGGPSAARASSALPRPKRTPPQIQASLPNRVQVTALSSLSVCPLQFFWRSQLNLNAWRPLAESEGAAEGGTWLHRVAEAVPRRLQEPNPPSTAEEWRSFLLDTLHTLLPGEETDLVFWTSLQQRLTSLAQWLANPSLPLPLRAEAVLEGQLPLSQARLRGRADWLIPQGVIDLKTTRPDELKRKIQLQHLDLQLQAYAWMLEPAEPQTTDYTLAFLSVQSDEVVSVPTPSQPDLLRTVDEALARIQQGEPIRALEALGSGEGCEQCPARGACRPEEWLA